MMLSSRVLSQHCRACRTGPISLLASSSIRRQPYIARQLPWYAVRLSSTEAAPPSPHVVIPTGSVEAGENKTGHIHTQPNESIFFLDSG